MTEAIVEQVKVKEKSRLAYRTIGEVAEVLKVPQHILRFWESKFEQINPQKNRGRRYYSPSDISSLKKIKYLLYEQGLTIKGAKQYLENDNANTIEISSQMNLIENTKTEQEHKNGELKRVLEVLYRSREKLLSLL